jgi:hypothetical protein
MKYIIQDWAGNVLFNGREFDSFEDGWDFISEHMAGGEDSNVEVIPKTGQVEEARFLDPKAPRALRHRS